MEEVTKEMVDRYDTVAGCPSWAQSTVDKLVAMGYLTGSSGKVDDQGRPADLDLSRDMLRILVICDRAGVFG